MALFHKKTASDESYYLASQWTLMWRKLKKHKLARFSLALLAILTVVSRLCAEAGVYYLHTNLFPCALLWGFLGEGSLGAQQLLILGMLSCVLFVDPRECFMPYVVESLQLNDRTQGRRLGRLATLGLVAIVLGLLVAIPCTLYFQYKNGAITVGDGWTLYSPPRMAIASNLQLRKTMEAQFLADCVKWYEGKYKDLW